MKKRSIAIAFLLLCATLFAGAQSLKDNQYLKRSTELRALADKAFDEGEYDDAARLASEAAEQARLSNRFVEESIIKLDAERWLKKADAAFTRAIASDAPSRRPAEYAAAATDLVAAREAYANQDYFAARDRARAAEAGCNLIAQADAREAIAKAEEEDAYLTRVGAAKAFTQLVSSGTYELVAARDSYGRSDWAMAATRAQGASAAFARAIDADAQAAIDGAFGDLAWARSVGAQDLYPEDFALAQDALTSALDSSSESLPRLAAAAARTSSLAVSEIARKDAMAAIAKAKEGTAWALAVSADYGAEYERATSAVADADGAFERGEWRVASERARAASAAVDEIARGEADKAIADARERLDYADSVDGANAAPDEYASATLALAEAIDAYAAEDWHGSAALAKDAARWFDAVAKADAADAIMDGAIYQSWIESSGASERRAADFGLAVAALNDARNEYDGEAWRESAAKAREALAGFDAIARAEADTALAAARDAADWAEGTGASEDFPAEYGEASAELGSATVAYDGGDYRTAAEAALRAQTALDLIARYEAEKSMLLADAMLDWAGGAKAGDRYPSEMASAQAARGQAEAAYLGRGWLAAIAKADEATSILDAIAKQDADYALWLAQAWIDWDVRTEAPKYYSDPYARAVAALEGAHDAYSQEAWISAIDRAMTSAAISYDGIAGAEAEATVNQAYEWLSWAHGIEAPYNYPAEYSRSSEALDKAYDEYVDGYWIPAADRAREAIAALQGVGPVERPAPPVVVVQKPVLPRTYTVRILPARTDCFWRIAGYPFIYSDPLKWPVLYEANKKLLKDPANPDLIHAGQVFVIPALGNEVREGAWDSKKEYPAFPKN